MGKIRDLVDGLADMFYPACCPVCGRHLADGEPGICLSCLADMPRLRFFEGRMPEIDGLFLGSRLVEQAVALFRYNRLSPYAEILKDVKYRNSPELARMLAKCFASELSQLDYFNQLDAVVPVPLFKEKLLKRGYNQSLFIAEGVSEVSGLPVVEWLKAVRPHATQTFRTAEERHRNVEGVFVAESEANGKRLLLVDDVITTGATLTACCDAFEEVGVMGLKILSLAFTNTLND